jgi:hypothetical protein
MIKSCRARREGAPPSSTAFPYLFVQALGNITRQHFRQLRSVSGDLSCIPVDFEAKPKELTGSRRSS